MGPEHTVLFLPVPKEHSERKKKNSKLPLNDLGKINKHPSDILTRWLKWFFFEEA